MPKGFAGLREELEKLEERKRKAQEGGSNPDYTPSLWFKLPESADGKVEAEITSAMRAVIHPLEDGEGVAYAAVHPVTVPGRQYPVDIVCRDQGGEGEPCPGCEAGLKRKLKGWVNVIWRDAPDFPQDENGKYNTKVDYESLTKSDKVAILSSGPMLFDRLSELDDDLDGIANYDLRITRKGLGLGTTYEVKKVKKVALSDADKALADEKPDTSSFASIPDYDEWVERAKGNFGKSDDDEAPKAPDNPLAKPDENIFAKA